MINQIYPFLEHSNLSQKDLRELSALFDNRDEIITGYLDNISVMSWMDYGRIETLEDLIESELLLLHVVEREFTLSHPLCKNTSSIIKILKGTI